MAHIYVLTAPAHRWSHWGDYGDILVHGMTNHLPRQAGELQLERVAPYIPPISFPGVSDVVLTDTTKTKLAALLPELTFKPVRKTRIVRLYWTEWDATANDPSVYPESGEPEDYILAQPHDEVLARELGLLWELTAEIDPEIQAPGGLLNVARHRGQHLVRANASGGYNFVSAELRTALMELVPSEITTRHAKKRIDA